MQTIEHGGSVYHIQDNGDAVLAEFTGQVRTLVLPRQIDGHPLTGVDHDAFEHAEPIAAFATEDGHPAFTVLDGVLFSADGKTLIRYPAGAAADRYQVPKGVTKLAAGAFLKAERLTAIYVPEGVREIEHHAFDGCGALTDISLPGTVSALGHCVFRGCGKLKNIDIPENHPLIELDGAFLIDLKEHAVVCCLPALCRAEMTVPEDIHYVDEYAFYGCLQLEKVQFHRGLRTLGRYAFYHCRNLKSVELHEGLRSIGTRAFSGCEELKTLFVPDSVTSIEYKAFNNCPRLYLSVNKGSYAARYCRQFGFPCKHRIQWPWQKS